jgi:hypothetical protein
MSVNLKNDKLPRWKDSGFRLNSFKTGWIIIKSREIMEDNKHMGGIFSYPSSPAAVIFGGHLSAQSR